MQSKLKDALEKKVLVFDGEADRAAQRQLVAHARKDVHGVLFDLLPRAPAVPALPQGKVCVDLVDVDGEVGGKPFDDGDERFAVRFARCHDLHDVTPFVYSVRYPARVTDTTISPNSSVR